MTFFNSTTALKVFSPLGLEGVTSVVDYVKWVSIPVKTQDGPHGKLKIERLTPYQRLQN